jgi:hypothetical protein
MDTRNGAPSGRALPDAIPDGTLIAPVRRIARDYLGG